MPRPFQMLAEVNPTDHFARCPWPESLYLHRSLLSFCCYFLGLLAVFPRESLIPQANSPCIYMYFYLFFFPNRDGCVVVKIPFDLQQLVKYSSPSLCSTRLMSLERPSVSHCHSAFELQRVACQHDYFFSTGLSCCHVIG